MNKGWIVGLIALPAVWSIAHADGPPSGWAVCNLNTDTYSQTSCIVKAERFKGTDAPYSEATSQDQAIALYTWAGSDPHPLSPCTARGVGGPLLPEELLAQCEDPTPTPTITETPTPVGTATPQPPVQPTPTVAPLALPTSIGEPAMVEYTYLPLIGRE